MAKVLRIVNRIVTIGFDDGHMEDYDIGYFNYEPSEGDEVKIYTGEDSILIVPAHERRETAGPGCRVNRTAYALFAILLGGIGAHEFYAGHTGKGILCVLFCWTSIPEIIGVIKGCIALTKPVDEEGNIIV
jgi:TM2 domain-containing membrane protein YozV